MKRSYAFWRGAARALCAILFPLRASGIENVPPDGPVVLCANHQSLTDPVAIACALDRPIRFMAKKELFSVPVLGALLRAIGAFSVDRSGGDLLAVKSALKILKEGGVFGIFPQGSRTFKNGGAFQSGAALIALRSGAKVVPVYIARRARLFRPIRLIFGASVDLTDFSGPLNSDALKEATGRIERAVYDLAPAEHC